MNDAPASFPSAALPETVVITRDHALQLIAVTSLLQAGSLQIHGTGADCAWRTLIEIGQECAAQPGGMP